MFLPPQFASWLERIPESLRLFIQRMTLDWREHANRRSLAIFVIGGFLVGALYIDVIAPPSQFPLQTLVSVPDGASAKEIAHILEENSVIQSSLAFRGLVYAMGAENSLHAGDYIFKEPKDIISVARVLAIGAFGLEPAKIRIPEGASMKDMAKLFSSRLQRFNVEAFLAQAPTQEGYLFPDTYYFLPNATEEVVIKAMRQNFEDHLSTILGDITASGRPLGDIVIMASILEKEGRGLDDRRMIAGVLWRRLKIEMPLQVDAAFLYTIGRTTFQLTSEDLKTDSPYNTYTNKGLPPTPIDSPSLISLQAAVTPIDKGYLFYLADHSGTTHYAKTYQEHLRFKAQYLR